MAIRTSKVLARYGVWVVTIYGIENTERYYPIEKARIWDDDWIQHIGMKIWCSGITLMDFELALADARRRFPQKTRRALAGGTR